MGTAMASVSKLLRRTGKNDMGSKSVTNSMLSSSPLIPSSLSMQWFFYGQTWQKMFRLSVKGLPSNKHVHLTCLLNQGPKTPEPPQTQQTTVESDCYCQQVPPKTFHDQLFSSHLGHLILFTSVFLSKSPLHVFHIYKMYNFFSKTPPKTPVNGSHVSHPSHGWMDGTFGLPPLNLAEDWWGWRT